MKRLLLLSTLTILTISSAGCGRMWSWLHRGDRCQGMQGIAGMQEQSAFGNACESMPAYSHGALSPPSTFGSILPGPETLPPGQ